MKLKIAIDDQGEKHPEGRLPKSIEAVTRESAMFEVLGSLCALANGEGGNDYDAPAAGLFDNDGGGPDDDGGEGDGDDEGDGK